LPLFWTLFEHFGEGVRYWPWSFVVSGEFNNLKDTIQFVKLFNMWYNYNIMVKIIKHGGKK